MTRMLRPALIGATSVACVALLSACGTEEKALADAPAPTTSAAVQLDPAALAQDWRTDLDGLVRTDTTPAQKAAAISGGEDLVQTFTKLAETIKGLKVEFDVRNPVVTGDGGKADILLTVDGEPYDKTYPAFFVKDGDDWVLNRAGACTMIGLSAVSCPEQVG